METTQTMTASEFSGDGSNLTNTTNYKLNTSTTIGRGNTINLIEGSNVLLSSTSNA
jgi:hypothetical protein